MLLTNYFDTKKKHFHCYLQEVQTSVKVKPGSRKWAAGYQPDLIGVLTWIDGEPPPPITAISVNSHYGL